MREGKIGCTIALGHDTLEYRNWIAEDFEPIEVERNRPQRASSGKHEMPCCMNS